MGNVGTRQRSNIPKCAVIDDSERIRIDSAPLHCPICLMIFRKAPEILICGHSFCDACINKVPSIIQMSRIPTNEPNVRVFECPLCRRASPVKRERVHNYAIEAILDSIESTTNQDDNDKLSNEVIATQKIQITRLNQKVAQFQCDLSASRLEKKFAEDKLTQQKRLNFALISILLVVIAIPLLRSLFFLVL